MPYNVSHRAIHKVKVYLDTMLESTGSVAFESNDPRKLRYALYNAIFSAKELGITQYADLGKRFRLSVKNGKVIATPTVDFVVSSSAVVYDEVTDWLEAINIIYKSKSATILFPNITEPHFVLKWCSENGRVCISLPKGIKIVNAKESEATFGNKRTQEEKLHGSLP